MISAGIDIGSRTVKLVVMEDGAVVHAHKQANSHDPLRVCRDLLADVPYDKITATGYGRHLFANYVECDVISEIKAFALGARAAIPGCRTILDIGGQDTKAISLDQKGKLSKFQMNDRCAAGTGRFLEIMATALGFSLADFGEKALQAAGSENINSMCAVFAESEVISMVARGARPDAVAHGIHQSIVKRATSMLQRVGLMDDIVFVGGVAFNPCIQTLLSQEIGRDIRTPDDPQIIGALGCALYGQTVNAM